jgi:hypothetical protein
MLSRTETLTLTGHTPSLRPFGPNWANKAAWEVDWSVMQSCVGYYQGSSFVITALFEDDDTAQVFADAMNAIEGFQAFTVAVLFEGGTA